MTSALTHKLPDEAELFRQMRDRADRTTHFSASSDRSAKLQDILLLLRNLPEGEFEDCVLNCKALVERYSQKASKKQADKKAQSKAQSLTRDRIAS